MSSGRGAHEKWTECGWLVLVLVLVLEPRHCRNCRYYRDCRRAGKRLLARVPVDEQTLVPPVAAAMAFGLVPCTRLALHVPHKMPYNNHDYGNPPLPIQKPMRKPLM